MARWRDLPYVVCFILLLMHPPVSSLANQKTNRATHGTREAHIPGKRSIHQTATAGMQRVNEELQVASERPSRLARSLLFSPGRPPAHARRGARSYVFRRGRASNRLSSRAAGAQKVTAGSSPLPAMDQSDAFKQSLQFACSQVTGGARSPPVQLAIAGMPNTGSNALHQHLAANLNISVRGEPSDEIWKHRLPFHPSFRDFLAEQCSKPTGWVGVIFIIRHPLAWLLSQTSDGYHSFAHHCLHSTVSSSVCVFGSCHIENFRAEACGHVAPPRKYSFPNLLDLWASYASHVPTNLPTVYVMRYEDLLHDPDAALKAVSRHFGVSIQRSGTDPLQTYSRKWDSQPSSSGIAESLGRLKRFEDFWGQFGVAVTGRNDSSTAGRPSGFACPPGDRQHLLISPHNTLTLRSIADRNVLSHPLAIHNYMVPSADEASTAWETCNTKTGPDRIIPLGYPTVIAGAVKLPGTASANTSLISLRKRCAQYFNGKSPVQLAVVGLPNSGSDALYRFLQDNLDVPVQPELPNLWKHLPPFHNRFRIILSQKCLSQASSSWTGIVFIVRHPLAWLQAQTTPGQEVGQTCMPDGMGVVQCFFETCDRGVHVGCAGKPHRYITPNLLHLWGAYVDHLPTGLRPFLVVRYEDLLQDSDAVLSAVSNHFRLTAKPGDTRVPLGSSTAQQQWQSFEALWEQFGVHSAVDHSHTAAPAGHAENAPSAIQCPQENNQHALVYPHTVEAMRSESTLQFLSRSLAKFGYQIPSAEAMLQAREACAGDFAFEPAEGPSVLHWHPVSGEVVNPPSPG